MAGSNINPNLMETSDIDLTFMSHRNILSSLQIGYVHGARSFLILLEVPNSAIPKAHQSSKGKHIIKSNYFANTCMPLDKASSFYPLLTLIPPENWQT
ncbi:hypothetical protein CDAR_38481 [Caerostris darwini]|uniref:Uncharacterized protein n=1 Tax=Caerostris darwini TaxID=1538125 RepID=A0AAV4QZQ8_9ARAC|nr:hypothetical protein CDAR_38481 [Caerostris darwini]